MESSKSITHFTSDKTEKTITALAYKVSKQRSEKNNNKFSLVGPQDMSGWRNGHQEHSDFPTFSQ